MTTTPTAVGVDSVSQSQPGYDGERAASVGSEPSAADHLRGMANWLRECTEGVTGIYGTVAEDIAALNAGADALDAQQAFREVSKSPPTQPVPAAKSESHNPSEGDRDVG